MTSHVFGNTPSPAVATYGLRQAVAKSDEDVKSFVCDDFYVDDGLTSLHSPGMSLGAISAAPLFKTLSMNVMK
jgi:hypothetical protein